jgi:uncharacterized protein (TIGR02246 family)
MIALCLILPTLLCTAPSPLDEVKAALSQQSAAWSRGDIDGFCRSYAEDAVFVSPSGITRGRQAVLDRYKKRYPTADEMGALTLEVVDARFFGHEPKPEGATVMARWTLSYKTKPAASGLTLVVLKRQEQGWQILQDASM